MAGKGRLETQASGTQVPAIKVSPGAHAVEVVSQYFPLTFGSHTQRPSELQYPASEQTLVESPGFTQLCLVHMLPTITELGLQRQTYSLLSRLFSLE